MNVVLISKEQFDLLDARLKELNDHLKHITAPSERFIDNKEFVKLMNVSYGTAQAWRDESKIGFSKEGKKIYYRMSDIEKFLNDFYQEASVPPQKKF